MYVYSQVAHTTQFLCSTARKNSLEWISSHPTNSTLFTVAELALIPRRRQSQPREKGFTRYILLTTVPSYLTLATFISAQRKSQPDLVEAAGRETNGVDCKADFRSSVSLTAAFSQCGCFAVRHPVDHSTSSQRNTWTPYWVRKCQFGIFIYAVISLQAEYLPKCSIFRGFYTHQNTGVLRKESRVSLEPDLTRLFHLASLVGPIKTEQDEIKRGDSFYQRYPRQFSLYWKPRGTEGEK